MKSFETEPIGHTTATNSSSDEHEVIVLGASSSNTSETKDDEISVGNTIIDSDLVYREDEGDEEPQRRKFAPPTRQQLLT